MNANIFNDEFNAAIGFECVFGSVCFDSMDDCAALFMMGNEL